MFRDPSLRLAIVFAPLTKAIMIADRRDKVYKSMPPGHRRPEGMPLYVTYVTE